MSYIFLQRPVIDTDIDTIVNAEVLLRYFCLITLNTSLNDDFSVSLGS